MTPLQAVVLVVAWAACGIFALTLKNVGVLGLAFGVTLLVLM